MLETVTARNHLDALVHSVQKSLTEYGEKVDADEKGKIEAALKEAEELLKEKDASKDAMESKAQALMTASQKLGEAMYAQSQAEAGAGANPQGGAGHAGASGSSDANEEKVVDAEFTEVKDKK
jgi:molecular chaperone DnaK